MKYVIIGNCAAAVNAIEGIREEDGGGSITVISEEKYPAYCRCLISYLVAGSRDENDLALRAKNFYEKMKVEVLFGRKAVSIKPAEKKILLENSQELNFDKLLIAAGGRARPAEIEGEEKEGVLKFRTIEDALALIKLLKTSKTAVILGGGLIGLKAACALKSRGLNVKVVVKSKELMSQVIDETAGGILRKHLEENGIEVITGAAAEKIAGEKEVESVSLDNGRQLKCALVVIGKGVTPNIDFVKGSGIKTNQGILADEYLQTSSKDIYAAGDCAEVYDIALEEPAVNALWTTACLQGKIAGNNMAGRGRIYEGALAENAVEFFGLPVISLGLRKVPQKNSRQYVEIIKRHPEKHNYKKIILKGNQLAGVINIGSFKNAGVYLSLIRGKIDVSQVKHLLLEDNFNYAQIKDLIGEKEERLSRAVSVEGKFV